jgi:hypothetical protein
MTDKLPEIRPNEGAKLDVHGGCDDTDEVCGQGYLHVEQMDKNLYRRRRPLCR